MALAWSVSVVWSQIVPVVGPLKRKFLSLIITMRQHLVLLRTIDNRFMTDLYRQRRLEIVEGFDKDLLYILTTNIP